MIDFNAILNTMVGKAAAYVPKVIGALVVLVVGLWFIRFIVNFSSKRMKRIDVSLRKFIISFAKIGLKILLLITVISMFGVQMTSFVALIGAAGLAVGLALQGSLSNFAGGVLILLFKPFKVGDIIESQGFTGKVDSIQIFNTVLKTPDNKTIILPNGDVSNGSVVNYSTEEKRRVDMVFGIGYDDDINKAKKVLEKVVASDKRILKDPKPQIVVAELADSSVNFKVRVWCKGTDYWDIYFNMQEKVKMEFDKAKISIPYPQQDIHLFKN